MTMKGMSRRARVALSRQVVEIGSIAAEMAAAAVGLRGSDAAEAMKRAERAVKKRRWDAISARAERRYRALNEKQIQVFENRIAAVLKQNDVCVNDDGEEQG